MSVSQKTRQIVWNLSGGCCAICRERLIQILDDCSGPELVGEVAHIVANKIDGPRGDKSIPGNDRDGHENLMLLCQQHHTLIDNNMHQYPVEKLLQIKTDHLLWVQNTLSPQQKLEGLDANISLVTETIFSGMLPVSDFPRFIYIAPCDIEEKDINALLVCSSDSSDSLMLSFIVRSNFLISFNQLDSELTPFRKIIDPYSAEKHYVSEWMKDPDKSRWIMQLLNRSLNKLTGRKGLHLDKDHARYYFPTKENGSDRSVSYKAPSGRYSSRNVAWRPITKMTGELKKHVEHLAVSLRFHCVGIDQWCMSIRPERRFTFDGFKSVDSKGVGKRATKKKSHMYNIDYLKEVHFWRDFLSDGLPRIVFKFGDKTRNCY